MKYMYFAPPVILLLVVVLIDIIYVVVRSKSLKTPIKLIRLGGVVFMIWVYGSAIPGEASEFIRSGQAASIGMSVLAVALILDTIVDFGNKT